MFISLRTASRALFVSYCFTCLFIFFLHLQCIISLAALYRYVLNSYADIIYAATDQGVDTSNRRGIAPQHRWASCIQTLRSLTGRRVHALLLSRRTRTVTSGILISRQCSDGRSFASFHKDLMGTTMMFIIL